MARQVVYRQPVPALSVPITVLIVGSAGWIQIAGSSAASTLTGTGSVSTVAWTCVTTAVAGVVMATTSRSPSPVPRAIRRGIRDSFY
jgi:hypothetical protein